MKHVNEISRVRPVALAATTTTTATTGKVGTAQSVLGVAGDVITALQDLITKIDGTKTGTTSA
jgi:hypothetical protein